MSDAPVLTSPRLTLRGHRASDFAASARMWADENVVRYISGDPSSGPESWSRLLRHVGHWRLMDYGYWVVEDRASGEFLGEVGFADYRRELSLGDRPEAGWVLPVHAHGRGIGREAVRCMLAWADASLDHEETTCIVQPGHARSVALARAVGFERHDLVDHRGEPILVMRRARRSA